MWQMGMEGSGLVHSDPFRVGHGAFYLLFFSAYLALAPLDLRRYQGAGVPPPVTLSDRERSIENQKPVLDEIPILCLKQ